MTIRCKCLKSAATLAESFEPGKEYELEASRANQFIAEGWMELVTPPKAEQATTRTTRTPRTARGRTVETATTN